MNHTLEGIWAFIRMRVLKLADQEGWAGGGVTIRKNSGADIGTRPRLNLIEGANIALTIADDAGDNEVDITITSSGGGGSADVKQVEVDVGVTPTWRGKFTLVDASITALSQVAIWHAPGPYTGKGTRADEAEMDPIWCVAEPAAGQATVYWRTMGGALPTLVPGQGSSATGRPSIAQAVAVLQHQPVVLLEPRVRGLVRGNVKFNYLIG